MIQSQRHIYDFIFETVAEAENSGRPHQICYVQENRTGYAFASSAPGLNVDHEQVLSSVYSINSRWYAIYGQFYKKNIEEGIILHTIPQDTTITIEDNAQYTIHGRPLIMGDGSIIELGSGSDLILVG